MIKEKVFVSYMLEIETALTEVFSLITEEGDEIEEMAR
eukprot:CAMPEP_0116872064 /NCGR_PEP_ID=MMETSP0463-20121206/2704_1 /TAXON_ID=181622 /ORGANISM="Strombidinopsis sp, Strain SopsisLIS2011" /LENGTH=37 /DNA_ID= /DNA_START= /DNA_END= /DNA_ORIENTATION=